MADKRQVKKTIRQLQRVKTWQLLVLLILMCFVSATFLRLNNVGMSERRQAVLAADKVDDSLAFENRLFELQQYVSRHMNTSTEAFYLEGHYKRDSAKIFAEATAEADPSTNVNNKADAVCKPRYAVWSPAYVQCFADELAKYPPSPDPAQNVSLPSTELYRHSFASPLWTPDFAGWSVLVCIVIIVMIALRMLSIGVLRLLLKRHYRDA